MKLKIIKSKNKRIYTNWIQSTKFQQKNIIEKNDFEIKKIKQNKNYYALASIRSLRSIKHSSLDV